MGAVQFEAGKPLRKGLSCNHWRTPLGHLNPSPGNGAHVFSGTYEEE